MMGKNPRNQIDWSPVPDTPTRARHPGGRPSCMRCIVGDHGLCVRAGCFCVHDVPKVGVNAPVAGASHDHIGGAS